MSLEQATTLHRQGRLDKAEVEYIGVLEDAPDDVNALYLLGTLWLQKKMPGIAAVLFTRCLQLKPDHFEAWNNLGNCHQCANRDKEAAECWEQAYRIPNRDPYEYADVLNNLGSRFVNQPDPEQGIPLIRKALELVPGHTDGHWNLGLLLLQIGNYAEGFDYYQQGWKTKNRLHRDYGANVPLWDGSPDKTIIVWGEQGIGDEILFASIIPDLMKISKQVIFDCHPRLVSIFEQSFPGIKCHGTRKDQYLDWVHKYPDVNAKIAIGDLGRMFRRDIKDFPGTPYLRASEERIAHYRKKLAKIGPKMKVGISWTGGYKKTRKDYRSIPLDQWKPVLGCDADFISLQYTPEAYQSVAEMEEQFDCRIHHWPSAVQNIDYHETAALISALDLVITVNTSAHHLAGALGKECWTLTPQGHAWRYYSPDGTTIPWYGSCYQYTQKNMNDWGGIMGQVARRLTKKVRGEEVKICA